MIPAGYSTTTTTAAAVTRWILFPAAVTGVTADSWNVTGDVARGVVSRRKGKFINGYSRYRVRRNTVYELCARSDPIGRTLRFPGPLRLHADTYLSVPFANVFSLNCALGLLPRALFVFILMQF